MPDAQLVAKRPEALTETTLLDAVADLAAGDRDIAAIVKRFGPPPMWHRPAGFATLVHIVLEQQVSLASAQAAFDRLEAAANPFTPGRFLELNDSELLEIGFSRQKARYVRGLAAAIRDGRFDLDEITELDDEAAHRSLVALTGIGPWTADIYLLLALRRPDIWPAADIALATAVAELKGLAGRPDVAAMESLGDAWGPWRSVAARLFWHDDLGRRGRADGRA